MQWPTASRHPPALPVGTEVAAPTIGGTPAVATVDPTSGSVTLMWSHAGTSFVLTGELGCAPSQPATIDDLAAVANGLA